MLLIRCFRLQEFLPVNCWFAVMCATAISAWADYPIASQHYAADPTGLELNGRIYLYCSNDEENYTNSYTMASIACFSTDDLKNWTDHGAVFRAPENASWASLAWAPSAISNNSRIYLYFANGAGSIGVATSSVPSGPFQDARGSSLINGSTPGASTPTQWLFDPCAFIDDDGQAYVYFGGQYPTNARVVRLNASLTSVSGSAMAMFATNLFEASYMHKRGGTYYYTYCNRFEFGAAIYCETNSNPTNGFVPEGTVLANPPQNVNNNNHHAIFQYQGNWYIAYHNRAAALQNGLSNGDAVYKRSLCLDRVNYNADGSIQQVAPTTDGLTQLKNLNPYNRVEGETIAQQHGVKTEVCSEGGMDVTCITNGCWIRVRGVDFSSGASTFYARVASAGSGGNIELHLDSLAGTWVGTCAVSPTGGWQSWTTVSCNASGTAGVHDLYLKFTGGAGNLFNLNWWQFALGAFQLKNATINSAQMFQTIEGLGGAIAFYNGWVTAHPYKQEIYTNAFAGLNLSMLRLGNWFRYQGTMNFDPDAPEFVSRANQILGRPVQVYMSSWAPPGFLKSNGQVGNGGTLLYTNGGFVYNEFAQYWYDSLVAYRNLGVSPTWISIQNEPDWEAGYDSCILRPTEGMFNGTNWAGYPNALAATSQRLANLPSPPKLLGPEVVHISFNTLQNYAATMNANNFYGVAYHLYGDSPDGTANGYLNALRTSTNYFPTKPRFMTEFGISNMVESATLIHNCLSEGRVSGYNFWSLVWPWNGLGLVQIEFPWNQAQWTNAPPGTPTQSHGYWLSPAYWSMKHFSYFIQPGFRRVAASSDDTNVLTSAYLSPDNLRLVIVFINKSTSVPSTLAIDTGSFPGDFSAVYQTAGANKFLPLGSLGSQLTLPAWSLTTVVLDRFLSVGQATNPSPTNNATGVALDGTLSWTSGSNALMHAVYLGINSDAVARATSASPEFKGFQTNNWFTPVALSGNTTWFWRVDEIAGVNSNAGPVWSFRTAPGPVLAHRYSFSETSGTTIADSAGGPVWNGTLPSGGTFSGGTLRLLSSSQQYASLPAGIVASLTDFTIEAWVKLVTTNNWARLFDFGNDTTVNMFLTPRNGSDGRVRFAITTGGAGAEQRITGPTGLSTNVWNHVAVTLSSTKGVLYVNGVPVATNSATTLNPAALGSTANNYIGKSQWPDPYLNGLIDEFRIYTVALSSAEIAATYALGPSQVLSTNSPPVNLAATSTNLTLTWPLASAGFTVQSRTNLALGDWVNFTSSSPQIVGGQWRIVVPRSSDLGATFYRLVK